MEEIKAVKIKILKSKIENRKIAIKIKRFYLTTFVELI